MSATAQIEALTLLCVPRGSLARWDPAAAKIGLQQLRRLRGEIASLEAVLVGTGEHLRHLKLVKDNDEAAELLELAPSLSPDEFAKTVLRYRIERDSKGVRERQQQSRSVKFFKADNGCVGMRVILPPVEGEQVKATLNEMCDAAWRAAHPERAETVGGHDDEPREQRLADALVNVFNGTSNGGAARTAVIVTMQAETLECKILGAGAIPTEDALNLVDDPRTDIYAAIQATDGAIMNFGRSRRLASPLQKLALALRDGGVCVNPGCEAPWTRCDADHIIEWDDGGLTDLVNLRLLDKNNCHKHRHETGIGISRQPDGTWTVDGEEFPPWPTPPPASDTEIITRWPPAAAPLDPEFRQLLRLLATTIERPGPSS